jgi:hypothetical protein
VGHQLAGAVIEHQASPDRALGGEGRQPADALVLAAVLGGGGLRLGDGGDVALAGRVTGCCALGEPSLASGLDLREQGLARLLGGLPERRDLRLACCQFQLRRALPLVEVARLDLLADHGCLDGDPVVFGLGGRDRGAEVAALALKFGRLIGDPVEVRPALGDIRRGAGRETAEEVIQVHDRVPFR